LKTVGPTVPIAVASAAFSGTLKGMKLHAIIDELADEADEFLAGAGSRSEARAGIAERLTIAYPKLAPDERAIVTDGVMKILEEEDFFAGPGPYGDTGDEDVEEEAG
jgi:hypothetical protein